MTTYTRDQVEAAMCIWEEILERLRRDDQNDSLVQFRCREGISELRICALEISPWAERVYEQIPDSVTDIYAWDFEILPLIFAQVGWDEHGYHLPSVETTAATVAAQLNGGAE